MTDVPDTVAEAEILLAGMVGHNEGPRQVTEYLDFIAGQIEEWKGKYAEASRQYWAAPSPELAQEALRAADEWAHLTRMAGAVLDEIRSTKQWLTVQDLRGQSIVVWRD